MFVFLFYNKIVEDVFFCITLKYHTQNTQFIIEVSNNEENVDDVFCYLVGGKLWTQC